MRVRIFSCGGTIDKVYFDANSEFEVGEPQIDAIFREANATIDYQVESLMRKDSLEMTDADRALIRSRIEAAPERLIMITHGTDTMTLTAEALLGIPDKTIVLTGSMTPARFRMSDAEFNIGLALGAVQSLSPGVYIAMNGQVFPAGSTSKNHERKRFEWISEKPDSEK